MNTHHTPRPLTRKIAIATIAASLGVSLGFPVGEVLAADDGSRPASAQSRHSRDRAPADPDKGSSNQAKFKDTSSNQGKFRDTSSNQGKFRDTSSNQGKFRDASSNQGKFRDASANQMKLRPEADAPQNAAADRGR